MNRLLILCVAIRLASAAASFAATDRPALATKATGRERPPFAVLTQRWRMVGNELYDIQHDPGQRSNIADQHPSVVEQLSETYERYFADADGREDPDTRFIVGAPKPIGATHARMKLGEIAMNRPIDVDDEAVTFETQLTAGPKRLQTYLTDAATGQQRGAYFVEFTRL